MFESGINVIKCTLDNTSYIKVLIVKLHDEGQ